MVCWVLRVQANLLDNPLRAEVRERRRAMRERGREMSERSREMREQGVNNGGLRYLSRFMLLEFPHKL